MPCLSAIIAIEKACILRREQKMTWRSVGSLFNIKADAIRMACKKFQLIQEIGPVPILPKRRKIGGNM
jgi:hypothetical protein